MRPKFPFPIFFSSETNNIPKKHRNPSIMFSLSYDKPHGHLYFTIEVGDFPRNPTHIYFLTPFQAY